MKTLAQLETEPRTMQFQIDRICPKALPFLTASQRERIESSLPMIVWVDLNRKPQISPEVDCHGRAYTIVTDMKNERRQFGLDPDKASSYVVCEHIGRLIE